MSRRSAGDGPWTWRDAIPGAGVCFAGRAPGESLDAAVRALAPPGVEPAWLRQVHSSAVLDAAPGCAGQGDALVSRRALALTVVTADCVPVLIAGDGEVAAVHAGWRGVEQRIVPAVVRRLRSTAAGSSTAAPITAWIGPAIGVCCYEVGDDVAARVCAAVDRGEGLVSVPAGGGRPHLDLRLAVERQLIASGVDRIRHVERCTFCHDDLWSYRRDGQRAGRNLACIWPLDGG